MTLAFQNRTNAAHLCKDEGRMYFVAKALFDKADMTALLKKQKLGIGNSHQPIS